jgi:hypothetical protein
MEKNDSIKMSEVMKRRDITGWSTKPETRPYPTVWRMYSDFCRQTVVARDLQGIPPLTIAVAYEDFLAGERAMRTFEGLFAGSEKFHLFDLRNTWKFDFLRIEGVRDAAVATAVRADIIVVSTRCANELPPAVKWWIETSLKTREGDPGAMVLLRDGSRGVESQHPPVEVYLAHCAHKGGLDFFVKRISAKSDPKSADIETSREETVGMAVRGSRAPARPLCNHRRLNRINLPS